MKGGKFVGWYLRYVDADGRRKQRASKQPTFAEARRMLVEIEAKVARGQVGIEERKPEQTLTLQELLDRFVEENRSPKIKDLHKYRMLRRTQLRRIGREAPRIAGLPLRSLTSHHLDKLRDALLSRYEPGTARQTMSALAAVLAWAVKQGLIDRSPAIGVQRPAAPTPKVDFLSADEVRRLLDEAERRAREGATEGETLLRWSRWVAVSIGLRLGLRKGELFGLRWQDIDLDGARLTVAKSYATTPKNGKARHLRLPSTLVALLREWQELCPTDTCVCPVLHYGIWQPARCPSWNHGLDELLAAAGCRVLPGRAFHLLRHTFASHFVQAGGSLFALSQILGHSDVKMTMIYAHLSADYMAEQIERVKF